MNKFYFSKTLFFSVAVGTTVVVALISSQIKLGEVEVVGIVARVLGLDARFCCDSQELRYPMGIIVNEQPLIT